MAAKLTGNKSQLATALAERERTSSTPMINTDVMRQYNQSYDPNQAVGVSGIKGTTPGSSTSSSPIVGAASSIIDTSKDSAKSFMDGLAGKVGSATSTPAPAGANGQPSTTNGAPTATATTPDYNKEREAAFSEYSKSITPDANTQGDIDQTRQKLLNSYGGETLEQALNRMRTEKNVSEVENRLNETNAQIRMNQQGLRNAQEQNFESGQGMTNPGIEQLRARNSRDFIRNISDLSNIKANTVDELNTINSQIDTVLRLRQQDRANTQQELKDRIELLGNTITPAQKELMKAKLDAKMKSIDAREQAEVDRVKKQNEYLIQRDYTVGDINSTDPIKRRVAIENAVNEVRKQYDGIPMVRSSSSMADDIQKLVESGMSLSDAIRKSIVEPIQQKPEYQDFIAKKLGTQDKYDYKPIQTTDANGNLMTTGYVAVNKLDPTDYRVLGVDANGMPSMGGGGGTSAGSSTDTAAVRNNNPGNIKFNPSGFNKALDAAGIKYAIGSAATDGGNFIKFDSIEDGLKARQMLLNSPSYANLTLEAGMRRWSSNGYGAEILPGVNPNTKIGDLTPEQKDILTRNQIKREDNNMYNKLYGGSSTPSSTTFDPAKAETYRNALAGNFPAGMKAGYANANKLVEEAKAWKNAQAGELNEKGYDPSLSSYYLKGTNIEKNELDSLGKSAKQFTTEAQAYIKDYGQQRFGKQGWDIKDPDMFSTLLASPEGKRLETQIPQKMAAIDAMNTKFDKLIKYVDENGPESFSVLGNQSNEMAQIYGQIQMDAKEALNLGVLNGPDMSVIQQQIPDPTAFWSNFMMGGKSVKKMLETARNSLNQQATSQLSSYGIEKMDTSKYK